MQTKVKVCHRVSLYEIWRAYQRALSKTTSTYAYDYGNRLTQAGNGLATSTYSYDQNGQRVKVTDGKGGVSLYPSKYFNASYDKDGRTISEISHIFAGDALLGTFEKKTSTVTENAGTCVIPSTSDFTLTLSCTVIGTAIAPASVIVNAGKVLTLSPNSKLLLDLNHFKLLIKKGGGVLIKKTATLRQVKPADTASTLASASVVAYTLTDHLGSVAVSTNAQGAVTELSDYYPYGSIRLDQKSGSLTEQRKYIGQEFDAQSGLSYLNARYYDGARGQFLNQDPKFISVSGDLADPQRLNSYSYGRNNPIVFLDTEGLDSAYFGSRLVFHDLGYHIYEAYSIDNQSMANQLNIGISVPTNVSKDNPFNFTLGFEPMGDRGSPLVMSVESAGSIPSFGGGDYKDASTHGFKSGDGQLSLNSYKNYAELANASVNVGQAITNAQNPYFGLGNNPISGLIFMRNYYNSNGAIGTVARNTGQGDIFNKFASGFARVFGKNDNVPPYKPVSLFTSGISNTTPSLIGNANGPFIGSYNFGNGIGTYNFGTKSWQ